MTERIFSPQNTQGLRLDVTSDPSSPIVARFFEGYDRAFVLANEKEGLEGFKTCLALNHEPLYRALHDRYGPFRELVLVATDLATSQVIGGANFIAYPLQGSEGTRLCANLNYVYSDPSQRRRGYLRRLVAAVGEVVDGLFPSLLSGPGPAVASAPLIFLEQNDPLRLSPEQYAHDTQHSGIDQVDRIGIWAKLGARILDFPYVQPPLSVEQAADRTLLYSVLGATQAELDPAVLRQHLTRFFGISVLKGKDPTVDASAAEQFALLAELEARGAKVALLDANPWLAQLPPPGTPQRLAGLEHYGSLLEVLRNFQLR